MSSLVEALKASTQQYRIHMGHQPNRLSMHPTVYRELCDELGCYAVVRFHNLTVFVSERMPYDQALVDYYPC
jgi:hypothetical protein